MPLKYASILACAAWISMFSLLSADDKKLPTFTDAKQAGADFLLQGEYQGELTADGKKVQFGLQVIALGEGKFHAVFYHGGLPGDGWEKGGEKQEGDGAVKNGVLVFESPQGSVKIRNEVAEVFDEAGKKVADGKHVTRESKTLGAKPPEGAMVLFSGENADAFENGTVTDDKLLNVGVSSKKSFGDSTWHLEFRTPFMPTATGQARGNSGVYLQDRYEIQVLDSFGLKGENNECGGLYSVQEPKLNMCYPPLSWQTYDIDFTAPRFDKSGKKTKNARVSVKLNGVVIYEDFELPKLTPGGASEEAAVGPLKLQNHGNPVHFRNIWVVEKKPVEKK